MNTKLKKGDEVYVISGKDRNKKGRILKLHPKSNRALVESINIVKKHTRATNQSQGGIIQKENPIDLSNLMLYCQSCKQRTRIGYQMENDTEKVRICKKCHAILDK